jgi:hypothetical protein
MAIFDDSPGITGLTMGTKGILSIARLSPGWAMQKAL